MCQSSEGHVDNVALSIHHENVDSTTKGDTNMAKVIVTNLNLEEEVKIIKTWEEKIAELSQMKEEKVNQIKEFMEKEQLSELQAGAFTIRLSEVVRNNFNTSAFKKKYLELYNAFIKQSTYKKFSIV